ncbi:conserved hypothetical protein [Theileria equi strain WA]|uniref:Uncharacterized protein n=1 Tax=Theileria equi strain WA TaxID=1537102 RepID=L1LES9_THEEQ|nr:conserved hypothetical protein [Theileria equi strain WA]EKX73846.1 conserved hypothetical protein [Theileria equi strain WA]|eukprot:XP_004833298.1 conserved hypothetical protein [Theileria equi strain WA]
MTKVKWESKEGLKIICTTCYTNLATYLEVANVRRLHNKF